MRSEEEKKTRHRRERIAAAVLVAIVALGSAVAWHLNRKLAVEASADKLYIPKPVTITPEVQLLIEYLRIDTSNPPGNERAGAAWLAARLLDSGIKSEIIESAPGRANLYARLEGKRPGGGLLLTNHIDVFPADAKKWTKPPFSGELQLDSLYGRGAIDMKGTAICQMLAFIELARSGRTPEYDVVFLAVADEEAGGRLGMRWLLENRPDIFDGIAYAINEGGITEMNREQLTYFGIEIGTKLPTSVVLHADSKEQLRQVRFALAPYFNSRKPQRITPEVRRFFRELAPHRIVYARELEDIDRAVASGRFWTLPTGYRELTQDTVFADPITAADGKFAMRVRMFNLPDTDALARAKWLEDFVKPFGVRLELPYSEPRSPVSDAGTPLFAIIGEEAKRQWRGSAVGTEILNGSYNDSRYLRRHGIQAYGVQPFPVDFFQSESIHAIDERLRVGSFQEGVPFMKRVVFRYALGDK